MNEPSKAAPVRALRPPSSTVRPRPAVAPRRRGGHRHFVRRLLALADVLGLVLAFALTFASFGSTSTSTNAFTPGGELAFFVATLPFWLLLAKLYGLYDRDEKYAAHSSVDDVLPIVTLITIGSWVFYVGSSVTGVAEPYAPKMLAFWALAIAFVLGARVAARALVRRRPGERETTIVVGDGRVGRLLARKIEDHPEFGIRLIGFVETDETSHDRGDVVGRVDDLPRIVEEHGVDRVLIAYANASPDEVVDLVRRLDALDVQVDIVPRFVELVTPSATIHTIEGLPVISLATVRPDRLLRAIKRCVDIVVAGVALALLTPAFGWIALRIKRDSAGPVLYRHRRVGLDGKEFELVKFRTMYADAASHAQRLEALLADPARRAEFARTHKLAVDPRVTPFGAFLRRLSFDELPQLVNVLRGDMSLVGPRPVTVDELWRYGDDAPTLLTFRPGVTGYWQINGRSRADYDERVRLDLVYVRGWSLKLDFLILGKTAWVVMTGHGAY
jgi:exopolysaccharide biosynthesis polyprenyl glycosylphosphotransferase